MLALALAQGGLLAQDNKAAADAKLPLTRLTLYSSGVGYFQRQGQVQGHAEVELRFKVDDINDLLKSMVVQDFDGGHVQTVTYGSRDPITKTLKSFGLDLTENPSLGQMLNQVRGEQAEILWPNKVTGTILGVERKKQAAGEKETVEVEFLNLLTDDGLQSIPLAQVQKTRLLNDAINSELRQALEVLAKGHDTQKKTVSITFDGEGSRKVRVGYISQTPVWKTSYRLVLEDQDKAFLQGWAIVENTSDEDWENVSLSLISGRPISFAMDLYQPLYTTRPVVQPEMYLSLRPQVYGEALESLDRKAGFVEKDAELGRLGLRALADNSINNQAPQQRGAFFKGENQPVSALAAGAPAFDSSVRLEAGVTAAAEGTQAGELFQYQIKSLVSLARQKSAMLPIINDSVQGAKLSIYNAMVQAKHPLNGLRFKNSTSLHLMQGPVTVFDANAYAGDARIEDVAPGQDRLISYGVDLRTEVEPRKTHTMGDISKLVIRKGTMILTRKSVEEMTYTVRNRDQKAKTVLIEHPYRSDWKLADPSSKPERTREVYRFPVKVESEKTEKIVVKEEKQIDEHTELSNYPSEYLVIMIKGQKVGQKIEKALQEILAMREELNRTTAQRTRREQEVNDISQEQNRIRENMSRLNSNSDLFTRYVKKLDAQETSLDAMKTEIATLKDAEAKQKKDLDTFLGNLTIE